MCNLSQYLSSASVLASLAGQPLHHKADARRQNSKHVTVAEENKYGSVSPTAKDSAFHSSSKDNMAIATYWSRYPTACAAAENGKLKNSDATVSVGLCTQETTAAGGKKRTVLQITGHHPEA